MKTDELFQEAESNEKLGNVDEAFTLYTKFIENACVCLNNLNEHNEKIALQKKLALAYNNRGLIQYKKVNFHEAIDDYTHSLQFDLQLPQTFYNRGLIHYRLGHYAAAIQDMKEALSIDPAFESAQKCLHQSKVDWEEKGQRR
ncbi:tetratricopeptide repeat protein 32-like [Gigantopelta aegis]|uniref:tetratricopeptide repeat protein 32-like n=1 Tax=Gigantopelta aegis TaxID=1735272 RepID=UPI001B88A076|nr:tetratricopeptide repeat protein 32-like [Gigantopelta aegis]